MRCQPIRCSNEIPPFRGTSSIKKLWRQGVISGQVKYGLYGDFLDQSNLSQEHLLAKSLGGKTVQSNLALASKRMNNRRSNFPLHLYLTETMLENYLKQFRNIHAGDFDGNKYIRQIRNTVRRIFRKEQNDSQTN